jgi:hypothetical protein
VTSDGGLFGSPRREGPTPKLVVIGIAWAAFGVVALITAVLMKSVGIAVFGVLCALAGGGLYLGQRARERLEEDERSWRSDPGGFDDDLDPGPDDDPDAVDDVAPDDGDHDGDHDGRHDTRVMSTTSRDHDDIVDAEYTEYYEPSPSEQDDGTGYDDEETAFRRRREEEWERETRAREDEPQVIEADDEDDRFEGARDRGTDRHPEDGDDGTDRDGSDGTDRGSRPTRDAQP